MARRPSAPQDETTPLLSYHNEGDGEGRWSLARRRSSAFLSFLSEPEDKSGDEYQRYHRKRTIYLIVALNTAYNIGIGIYNSFAVELIQTLACAEYYYSSTSTGSPFPTLPSAGDPSDLCSVPWVDKRTSQMATYMDTFGSLTACVASLFIAKGLFPRFSRRSIGIASVLATMIFAIGLASIPTHYSFDADVPSSSTLPPTTSMYLVLSLFIVAGFLGAPQTAMPLLSQVMVLDVCREDEKTSGFAQVFASMTLGMGLASMLLRFVLPSFGLNFSILHHSGPFSPFWIVVTTFAITLTLVVLFLPETKPIAAARADSRRASFSSDDSHASIDAPGYEAQQRPAVLPDDSERSSTGSVLQSVKEMFGLFGYLLPYQPHEGAKRDFKLPLMLCAVVFGDTITMVWSNLVVFCSTHLHFGPQETTTLLGILGATKGLFSLFALPWIVKAVRRMVKKRMTEEIMAVSTEELSQETRVVKREESVILTDRLVATAALGCDFLGFTAMGIAASHLSSKGIYGSKYIHLTRAPS